MTVRVNKQKINLREKLTEFEDKVNFDEVVRGLGEYTGNVGIGTTEPDAKLEIADLTGSPQLLINNAGTSYGTASIKFYSGGTGNPVSLIESGGTNSGKHGLFFSTGFETGSVSTQMVIDSDGKVGIGTTSPESRLHVHGDLTFAGSTSGNQGTRARILHTSGAAANGEDSKNDGGLILQSNNNGSYVDGLTIDHNGHCGIGTTSPDAKLEVYGAGGQAIKITSTDTGDVNNPAMGLISISDTGELSLYRGSEGGAGVEKGILIRAADASGHIKFDTGGGASPIERMRIDSAGQVGIGTTSPEFKLDVADQTTLSLGADSSNNRADSTNKSSRVGGVHYDNDKNPVNMMMHYCNATENLLYFGWGTSAMVCPTKIVFGTASNNNTLSSASTGNQRMVIDGSGQVGIGTTDPGSHKLNVNGSTFCTDGNWAGSDDRIKHNEQNIVGAIETLGKITPKKYIKTTEMYEANHDFELDADDNPIDENGEPVKHIVEAGVIAQQVLGVPELAFMVSPEGLDEDGNVTSPHGLNYNSLLTYAIAAIQELKSEIETLKLQINPNDSNSLQEPVSEETTEEVIEEPVVEEPVSEETTEEVIEEPVVEEPVSEEVAEEVVEGPVVEEPVSEETTEEVIEEPVVGEPVSEEATEEVVEEPVVEEPVSEEATEEEAAEESQSDPEDNPEITN